MAYYPDKKVKKAPFQTKMLSQCPKCRAVLMTFPDGRDRYQQSVVVFEKLPQELCWEHSKKPLAEGEIPM